MHDDRVQSVHIWCITFSPSAEMFTKHVCVYCAWHATHRQSIIDLQFNWP